MNRQAHTLRLHECYIHWIFAWTGYSPYLESPLSNPADHRRRLRGQPGRVPPIIELGGKGILLPPQKIQVRIFENIETTSETKAKNLNTTRKNHNENNYYFQLFTPYNLQNFVTSKINM